MLVQLSLKHFVLVDQDKVDFQAGMTAITGETGAGKSMMLDALHIVMGHAGRSAHLIQEPHPRATIQATFDISHDPPTQAWLDERGWLDDDKQLFLERILVKPGHGRSRCTINGHPCQRQSLEELSTYLVQSYRQHHAQTLKQPAQQRQILDQLGAHETACLAVQEAYSKLREAEKHLDHWSALVHQGQSQEALITFYIEELQALQPQAGEAERLLEQRRQAQRSHEQAQDMATLTHCLSSEGAQAPQRQLMEAERCLMRFGDSPQTQDLQACLQTALIALQEAQNTLIEWQQAREHQSWNMEQIEERLQAMHTLARKHQTTPEALPECLQDLLDQQALFQEAQSKLVDAQQAHHQADQAYQRAAQALSELRHASAQTWSQRLQDCLPELGLSAGRLRIEVEPHAQQRHAHGWDTVTILFSANHGTPLGPVAEVASGGELSRIALLLASHSSSHRKSTLLFDEIDSGISGQTASYVGKLLRDLGQQHQCLCITHLPQVAAFAQQHIHLSKTHDDAQTALRITNLDAEGRQATLAQLISGRTLSPMALEQAQLLLDESQDIVYT